MKDKEAWRAAVHGVAKSQARLSDRTTTTQQGEQLALWPWLPNPQPEVGTLAERRASLKATSGSSILRAKRSYGLVPLTPILFFGAK